MDLAAHLADLVQASSITGQERAVGELLLSQWAPVVDEARLDKLGSYIGLKRGIQHSHGSIQNAPPRIMAAAHIDSIGGMVTALEPGGFLRFTTVGGVDRRLLMAQEVEVHGQDVVYGVIGSKPPHLTSREERNKLPSLDDLYIDTGLADDELRRRVPVGAPVLPRFVFRRLQNQRISSRYLDNRAGVAALRVALEELQRLRHTADFYAVGTVGEEFGGLSGAVTTTFAIKPDIAIAVDVTFAQHPGSEEDAYPLGEGPTIGVGPNCTPKLVKVFRQIAEEIGVRYQLEVMPGFSGTDAWGMQVVRGGSATGILSIPLRYMHTPVETVALRDIQEAGRLLAHFVARVDAALVEDLSCY